MKTSIKAKGVNLVNVKKQDEIDNQKMIALHLEEAAKHYEEAKKQKEAGEHEKAVQSTIIAQGHFRFAFDYPY